MTASLEPATPLDPLLHDFVEWLAREPRTYGDALEAWRTSCPRLTVWEDALDRGFVDRQHSGRNGTILAVTAKGLDFLRSRCSDHGAIPRRTSV